MRFDIDTTKTHGMISPAWFGHNLEHTRSCVWQGLSAELIRNRKFAGMPQQHTGVSQYWYRIGPPQAGISSSASGTDGSGTTGLPTPGTSTPKPIHASAPPGRTRADDSASKPSTRRNLPASANRACT